MLHQLRGGLDDNLKGILYSIALTPTSGPAPENAEQSATLPDIKALGEELGKAA
jgi:hypothetical protein